MRRVPTMMAAVSLRCSRSTWKVCRACVPHLQILPARSRAAAQPRHVCPRGLRQLVSHAPHTRTGVEFTLLPWMLLNGALCGVSFLLIEWHLATTAPEQRLAGLGLRLAFDGLLRDGCAQPPLAVLHDEFAANNLNTPVPGLRELLEQREPYYPPSRWTAGVWSKDEAHLRARKAEAAHLGASEAARQAKASSIATPMSVGEQPRCYGSCPTRCYDDLRFVNESELSYRFSWRQADEPTPFPITPGAQCLSSLRKANKASGSSRPSGVLPFSA